MSEEQGYQGWKNYQTWVVALWFDNEQWIYHEARLIAQDTKTLHLSEKCEDLRALAEVVVCYEELKGLAHDLMGNALDDVDWQSIIEHMAEE